MTDQEERARFEAAHEKLFGYAPKWLADRGYYSLNSQDRWKLWLAAKAEARAEQRERRSHAGGFKFAGWFKELRSGMSYRLWEQGGHEQQPGEVALYEDASAPIRATPPSADAGRSS